MLVLHQKKNCWPVRNFLTFWTLFPKLVFFGNKENERRELAFGENWKIRQCQTSSFWAISLSQMGWIPLIIEDGAEENSFFTNRVLSCDACRKENSFFFMKLQFLVKVLHFFLHMITIFSVDWIANIWQCKWGLNSWKFFKSATPKGCQMIV